MNVTDSDDGVLSIKRTLSFASEALEFSVLPDGRLRVDCQVLDPGGEKLMTPTVPP